MEGLSLLRLSLLAFPAICTSLELSSLRTMQWNVARPLGALDKPAVVLRP